MLRTWRQTLKTRTIIGKSIPVILLFCVLSSALPAEAVFNSYSSMPCCHGIAGMSGECHGNSCPMHRRSQASSPQPAQHDHECAEGHAPQASEEHAPAPHAHSQHAHSHEQTQAEVEHSHDAGVSPQNTAQDASRRTSAGVASIIKPCPSDCCGASAGAFAGQRRPRHDALLADVLRPRPPSAGLLRRASSEIYKAASSKHRSHPPRAPPSNLNAE